MALDSDGVLYVLEYEKHQGRRPLDVSRGRKFPGIDIISAGEDVEDLITIEVKATRSREIPDAYETEFTRGARFVATHLYVVRFTQDGRVDSLHVVPKSVIDEYSTPDKHGSAHRTIQHVKFASGLKTRMRKDEFRVLSE